MWKTDSLEKTLMLGKIEGRRRRGWQDEMVEWHHWLNGDEFEQTVGVGDGQGGLACCGSWGCKESDTTERLSDWTELFPQLRKTQCIISKKKLSTNAAALGLASPQRETSYRAVFIMSAGCTSWHSVESFCVRMSAGRCCRSALGGGHLT